MFESAARSKKQKIPARNTERGLISFSTSELRSDADRSLRTLTSIRANGFCLLVAWADQRTAAAQATFEIGCWTSCGTTAAATTTGSLWLSRFVSLLVRFGPVNSLARETDLSLVRINSQDLDLELVADLDHLLRVIDLLLRELRDMEEPFETIFESDEHAEVGDLGDLALDHLTRLILAGDIVRPWIASQLLQTQSNAATFAIDRQDSALDLLPLFQHLAGVADLASPRDICSPLRSTPKTATSIISPILTKSLG